MSETLTVKELEGGLVYLLWITITVNSISVLSSLVISLQPPPQFPYLLLNYLLLTYLS